MPSLCIITNINIEIKKRNVCGYKYMCVIMSAQLYTWLSTLNNENKTVMLCFLTYVLPFRFFAGLTDST